LASGPLSAKFPPGSNF